MHVRLKTLAAALITCSAHTWAATGNVDVYGSVNLDTLPTHGTYSTAGDFGPNYFSQPFAPTISATGISDQTAGIALTDYTAQAKTTLGGNHAYTQASGFSSGAFSVNSFSGWYDQITITGGTGTGTANFAVQLNGVVDAGAYLGVAGFSLLASNVHPTQLGSEALAFNILQAATPWALDSNQVTEIVSYDIAASHYNDFNLIAGFFGPGPSRSPVPYPTPDPDSDPASPGGPGLGGIPSLIADSSKLLGSDAGMAPPEYLPNLIVTPGADQTVNTLLIGTFNFTYDEAFYLIGTLETSILGDGLKLFCSFGAIIADISSDPCAAPPKDGTGATTLDFFNSANLINFGLPEGATARSASGQRFNLAAVPEPSSLALAGLGLLAMSIVGRPRRRT